MKKLLTGLLLAIFMVSGVSTEVSAQRMMTVRVMPQAPKYRKPPMPARGFVWISDSWRWERGRYVFVPGYWMRPPNRNARYIAGRWDRTRYGWVWMDGYWAGNNSRDRYDYRDNDRYGGNGRYEDDYDRRYNDRNNNRRYNDD